MKKTTMAMMAGLCATAALADGGMGSKPLGFRFFENRLTIKPYVDLTYTWDSNVDTTKHASDDNIFMIKPGADFAWRGDRWEIAGSVWYRYNWYCEYGDNMDESSYGESLAYSWTTADRDGKGWSLMLAERYAYISQSDSIGDGGRGIWRDREQINVSGALERRFTDLWHASLSGQYDWIDYKNDLSKYAPLYGWDEWSVGLEAGYAASKWTDILVSGGYSNYGNDSYQGADHHYDNSSESWTIQGGIGTHATEKISYRVLMGWSILNYGGESDADNGWTYSLSGNWRILRNLQWSALGQSYYQPSERAHGSAVKVYSLSTGLSYLTFGDRVTFSGDVTWRYEESVYCDSAVRYEDYDEQLLEFRLGASYTLNRWVSLHADLTYETEFCDKKSSYEFDRVRGTVGVMLHY